MSRSPRQQFVDHLADTLLAGSWQAKQMLERAHFAVTKPHSWLEHLIPTILHDFPVRRPTPWHLRKVISHSPFFCQAWSDQAKRPEIDGYSLDPISMESPAPPLAHLCLPQLATPADLAQWFGLTPSRLDWFADPLGLQGKGSEGPCHHYMYRWHKKREGLPRLIESPKSQLKSMQRYILREILDQVPTHNAAHGFCRGRSCLSFASPHAEKAVVIRMDLKDFFPSIRPSRIHAIFRTLGYPWETARLLTGLCTHTAIDLFRVLPAHRRHPWDVRKKFLQPHLPQGAPTSPALANLCAYRLYCRLSALARSLEFSYTRYADDLAFSGDRELARKNDRFRILVGAIALEEGFSLNMRKTKVMGRGGRQQLTGLVVNNGSNIPRPEYDRLKAVLYNCTRYGSHSQNLNGHKDFRNYLVGKIAWVNSVNQRRGQRLGELFAKIDWKS